jgi:hypothetical protein
MSLDHDRQHRLAPDAAPGAPFADNIIPFPMARCNADEEVVSPQELLEIEEWARELRLLNPGSTHVRDTTDRLDNLTRSVRVLALHAARLEEARDTLLARLELSPLQGDF